MTIFSLGGGAGGLEKNLDITWRIIMPFGVDQM